MNVTSEARRFEVVALGEAMVEFNQTDPAVAQYQQGFGGDTSNAIIAASRAGARTAYLTRVGNDWVGQKLLALWREEGVDTSHIEIDAVQPTGMYFVTHGKSGHEFHYMRKGSAASCMTPDWLPKAAIEQAKILHVSGISLAISESATDTVIAAMRYATQVGTVVSLDSNLRLKLWPLDRARQVLEEAIGLCDLFLPSREDIEILINGTAASHSQIGLQADFILDWCHERGAKTVVLKLGSEGCVVSDGKTRATLAPRLVEAVDATGAGDCFCGNLLAKIAEGDSLAEAARYANVAASLAVQGFGAVAPLPTRAQVLRCSPAALA
jgi:2-dehydro-3-deoxygluconokinase